MAVRSGMQYIIDELRSLTAASEGESTVNEVEYWTDEQLQDVLDKNRRDIDLMRISPVITYEAGIATYKKYQLPEQLRSNMLEMSTDGIEVLNATMIKQAYGVSYTYNPDNLTINFIASTGGRTYYMNARSYNLNLAAANVWQHKASHRFELIKWKTDNHTFDEDAEYQHCLERADYFRSRAATSSRWLRYDQNVTRMYS